VKDHLEYERTLEALGICLALRVPVLLWGPPGEGKTSVVESARGSGWQVETLICSHYEPSDFAGLPVVGADGRVSLAPPGWARRAAEHEGPSIVFFDEWTTAAPAVQAAALRPLTHGHVGDLQLPPRVSFAAAANPADVAASGWELAAPTANRFVHLEWSMPLDVYTESVVTGTWPRLKVPEVPSDIDALTASARSLSVSFLRARGGGLSAVPSDAAGRGRAFPTPRTWDYTARLLALADVTGVHSDVKRLLVHGAIGAPAGHEFLTWIASLDLPDPETVLDDPGGEWAEGMRPDQVHATLQGVLAAVVRDSTADRWTAALDACGSAGSRVGIDAAVPVVRALLRGGTRPPGALVPASVSVFAAPLALAGLLPEPEAA
jgi:MoxR-like ATPase